MQNNFKPQYNMTSIEKDRYIGLESMTNTTPTPPPPKRNNKVIDKRKSTSSKVIIKSTNHDKK